MTLTIGIEYRKRTILEIIHSSEEWSFPDLLPSNSNGMASIGLWVILQVKFERLRIEASTTTIHLDTSHYNTHR